MAGSGTESFGQWFPDRPNTLVVACSDGRLQEATDEFLSYTLDIHRYDRLYVPGGGGALSVSGGDFLRAYQLRRECRYLVELHDVKQIVVLFHGPSPGGRIEAACADYRRKMPWASVAALREKQEQDVADLRDRREDWAGKAEMLAYRCEVSPNGSIHFTDLLAIQRGQSRS
jgi:hypothetical protein